MRKALASVALLGVFAGCTSVETERRGHRLDQSFTLDRQRYTVSVENDHGTLRLCLRRAKRRRCLHISADPRP